MPDPRKGAYSLADAKPIGQFSLEEAKPVESTSHAPVDSESLAIAAAGHIVPLVRNLALQAATNPNAKSIGSVVGQIAGGIGGGMAGYNTPYPGGMMIGATNGMWAGGKAGWRLTAAAQKLGIPVAQALEKIAPYAQALNTASGVLGVGDLAQIENPTRQDAHMVGFTVAPPTAEQVAQRQSEAQGAADAESKQKQAAWNTLHDEVADAIHRALVKVGYVQK